MDYDTFIHIFPSETFLSKHLVSKARFKRRFMLGFFIGGFLCVGMSDVGLSNLYESGAVSTVFGRPIIIPWKFDATELYQRQVREMTHGILDIVASMVFRMQDQPLYLNPVRIGRNGSISWGRGYMSVEAVAEATQTPPEKVKALIADMCAVLGNEALEWPAVGTFTVQGDTIVCEPNPISSVARLAPLGRPPHPVMPRSDDSGTAYVKATRIEKPKARP